MCCNVAHQICFLFFHLIVRVIPSLLIDNTYNWLMCIISTFCIDDLATNISRWYFFLCTLYLVLHVIPFIGEYNWQNKSTINLNKEPDHLDILYIVQVFEFRVCFSNFQRVFLFFDFWIHSHCWNVLVKGPKIVVLFLDFLTWNQKTYQDYKTWSFYAEINSRQRVI